MKKREGNGGGLLPQLGPRNPMAALGSKRSKQHVLLFKTKNRNAPTILILGLSLSTAA